MQNQSQYFFGFESASWTLPHQQALKVAGCGHLTCTQHHTTSTQCATAYGTVCSQCFPFGKRQNVKMLMPASGLQGQSTSKQSIRGEMQLGPQNNSQHNQPISTEKWLKLGGLDQFLEWYRLYRCIAQQSNTHLKLQYSWLLHGDGSIVQGCIYPRCFWECGSQQSRNSRALRHAT